MIDHRHEAIKVGTELYAELTPTLSALAEQPEPSHLCEVLALADGFQFQMVVCETPRVGAALLLWLDSEIARRRGEAVTLMRLSPYPFVPWDATAGLPPEELARLILEPLVSLQSAEVGTCVIDASPASSRDHEAWVWLFKRINERRNLIASRFQRPLSIFLSPALEVELIHAAPDLWSVRSLATTIRTPAGMPVRTLPYSLAARPLSMAEGVAAEELAQARQAAATGHPAALRRLAILLLRHAEAELFEGRPDSALSILVAEVLPLSEQLKDTSLRARALQDMARIRLIHGALDEALTLLQKQVLPAYEADGQEYARAVTLGEIANILLFRGQLDEALHTLREQCLPAYEKLGNIIDLSFARSQLAATYLQRNQPGDREKAAELLQLALMDADKLRIPVAEWIRQLQKRLGLGV